MRNKEIKNRVKVIGVTGGIGAGKSRILNILESEYGARVIQADQVAKELEEPGQEGLRLLTEAFGTSILDGEGRLDRQAFAQMIFRDENALLQVNAIIHPLTWERICQMVSESSHPLVVVEAALFSQESRGVCQELWYVDAKQECRIQRLMENRGYAREKCLDIMANQPDRDYFLKLADVVIDNNGTVEQVRRQIETHLGSSVQPEKIRKHTNEIR